MEKQKKLNPTSEMNNLSWKLGQRSRQSSRLITVMLGFTVVASVPSLRTSRDRCNSSGSSAKYETEVGLLLIVTNY